jgi:hypothetical protein
LTCPLLPLVECRFLQPFTLCKFLLYPPFHLFHSISLIWLYNIYHSAGQHICLSSIQLPHPSPLNYNSKKITITQKTGNP